MSVPSRQTLACILLLLALSGCVPAAGSSRTFPAEERISHLRNDLMALGSNVSEQEALAVADRAVRAAEMLSERYGLVSPPLLHNVLVNLGVRERGLCVHWTEDLLKELKSLGLTSLEFHWGVANRGKVLMIEHSSVVVTAKGEPFVTGIVLDGWRSSGRLYWTMIKSDTYRWEKLEEEPLVSGNEPS